MNNFSIIQKSQLEGAERIDAEYYQPNYLNSKKILGLWNSKFLNEIAYITDGSHEIRSYQNEGVLFLRSQDVFETGLQVQEEVYISKTEDTILKRSKPRVGDILITKTGNVGASLIVDKEFPDSNLPADIALVRLKNNDVNPYFVATYINSSFGRSLLYREMTGSGRPRVVLENLNIISIPLLPLNKQDAIEHLVKGVYESMRLSESYYIQAEDLLFSKLGVKNFDDSEELFYTVNFKDIISSSRLDPQHFQPLVNKLIKIIADKGGVSIEEIELFNKRGAQPLYTEDGDVQVITSKHLGTTSISYDNLDKTTIKEWESNKTAQIQQYDTLIYTTGANIGRTNCYLEDKKSLASNHINILRVKQLDPIYLSVFLNSFLGKKQVDKFITGSAQAELYSSDISKFVIWNAPMEIQKEIAGLVRKSHEARKKSKELLEEAKRKVEEMIEKGGEN